MNLFYKIHLQAFNVIFIVLYHSGPTFGQVLYSCLNAFVVDASDYSGHLIRHLLNASEGGTGVTTWVISEVLHTVCFLLKKEFILQKNLQAFHVISIVFYHSGPTFGHDDARKTLRHQ
jgi:hypothetical protein